MLTWGQQGMLVCDALNRLPHPDDLIAGENGCCPDCCAPCGLLKELVDAELLNTVVMQAPAHLWGPGTSWWNGSGVNTDWLANCWGCQDNPPCEREDRNP